MKIESREMTATIASGATTRFEFQPQPEETAVDGSTAWVVQRVAFEPIVKGLVVRYVGVRENLLATLVEVDGWPGIPWESRIIVPRMSRLRIDVANTGPEERTVTVRIAGKPWRTA